MISDVVLMIHFAATWFMVGLIWFVQVVHYPLFGQIPIESFPKYEQAHQRFTGWVVGPVMLTEGITAIALVALSWASADFLWFATGLIVLLLIAASTWGVQIPLHEKLAEHFDTLVHRQLVRTNWLRTALWSVRGTLLLIWMIFRIPLPTF